MSSIRRRTRSNTSANERQALVDEWERKEPTPAPPAGMSSAVPNFLLKAEEEPAASSSSPHANTNNNQSIENTIVKIETKDPVPSNKRKRTRVISDGDDDDDDDSSVMIMEDERKDQKRSTLPAPPAAAPAEVKVKLERNLSTVQEEKKEMPASSSSSTAMDHDGNKTADEEDDACAICFEEPPIDPATLDSCKHSFCFECIFRWSTEVANSCPLCKHDIHQITHYGAKDAEAEEKQEEMMDGDEDVVILSKAPARKGPSTSVAAKSKPAVETRKPIVVPIATKLQKVTWENNDENLPPEVRNARCQQCANDNNEDQLLLCDGCDQAWHTYCVGLDKVPEGDFFCPQCEGDEDEDDESSAEEDDEPKRKRLKRARDTTRGGRGGRGRGRGRPRRDGASAIAASATPLPLEHPTRHQPSRVRQTSSLSTLSSPNDDFASQMAARLAGLAPPKPVVSAGMSARARLSVPSSITTSSPFTAPLPSAAAAAAVSSPFTAAASSSSSSYFSGSAPVVPTASPHARTKKTTVSTLEAAWNARNELMMQRERERFMAARREAREILKRQEEFARAKTFNSTPRPRPLHSLAINAHAAAAAANSAASTSSSGADWGSRLTPPPSTYRPNFCSSLPPSSSSSSSLKFKPSVATTSRFTAPTKTTTSSSSPNNSSNNSPLRRRIPKKFEPVQMKFNSSNSNPSSPSLGPNASPTGSFPSSSPFLQRHVSPSWGAAAAAASASSSANSNIPTSASKPPHTSSSSTQQNHGLSRISIAPASSLARIPSPVTTPTAAGSTSPFAATNGNWSNFGPSLKPRSVSPPIQKPSISRPVSAAAAPAPTGTPIAVASTEAARFFPSAGPVVRPAPALPPMPSFEDFAELYSGSDGDSTAPVTVGTQSSKSNRHHSHSHSSHDKHREERRREKEKQRAKEREREKQREKAQQSLSVGSTTAASAAAPSAPASASSRPFTVAGQPIGIYQHPNHRQRLAASAADASVKAQL